MDSDEEAIAQVLQMVRDGQVKAVDGSLVAVQADSICLHGDGPHSVVFAEKIRQELLAAGIKVSA